MIGKIPQPSLYRFLLDEFYPDHFQGKSIDTKRTYDRAIAWFDDSLDRRSNLGDLTAENLEAFWQWSQQKLARSTARCALQRLRTLWRAAFKAGHTITEPPEPWWWHSGLRPAPGTSAESKPPPVAMPLPPVPLKPGERPATVADLLPFYVLERGLCLKAAKALRYRLTAFERALGRPAQWDDLNEMTINLWLAQMMEVSPPDTVRGNRAAVVALWNFAYESRIVETFPTRRVRRIKKRAQRPKAWTIGELDQLLRTTDRLTGFMKRSRRSVERRVFWKALILLAYYSGLRLGDLEALRWSDISTEGILTVVQSKTGDLVACQLPPDMLEIISLLHGEGRERVFSDLISRRNIMEFFARLVHAAGLHGSIKWLRRSGASHVEAMLPGGARGFLGHRSDSSLAYAHYVDPTIAQRLKPMPPRIGGPEPTEAS